VSKPRKITITSKDGIRATAQLTGNSKRNEKTNLLVETDAGQKFYIPFKLLVRENANRYYLPVNLSQLDHIDTGNKANKSPTEQPVLVLPVIAEEAEIHKQTVETGRVRLTKRVHEREEEVTEPLFHEEVQVERVPINQYIDQPAEVRQEGDTTIVPVMEEVLVVEKRILLKEEVHITRQSRTEEQTQTVKLREEEVVVERRN
jgi:uncharacterized protein (TIGR02271 family)